MSTIEVDNRETMSSNLAAGSYEVRVVYYSGSAVQSYQLQITRPN
jgi:hypothetical protein